MEKDEAEFYKQKRKGGRTALHSYCKKCHMASSAEQARRDPEGRRDIVWRSDLKNRYGKSLQWYVETLAAQGGKCALFEVCGHTEPGGVYGRWYVDHDHETGECRGLLCQECNSFRVGKNTLESIKAVVIYLEKARKPKPE
jgi:hypothetical protein